MNEQKHLILVLARGGSKRVPNKNIQPAFMGRPALAHVLDIAHHPNSLANTVVVSTECARVKSVALDYPETQVVMRDLSWSDVYFNDVVGRSLHLAQDKTGIKFKYCTVLLGISIFWRPSWIKESLNILQSMKIASGREPVTHVVPTSKLENLAFTFRIGFNCYMPYILPHRGINFDINTPEQYEIAKGIMNAIQSGVIPYSLDEQIHQTPDFQRDAELRSHMI